MIHIDDKVIGRHIQAGRIQKQMTQSELANRLDVSESYVSRIECGRNRVNIERLLEICMILDLPVDNILQECSDYNVMKQDQSEDPLKKRLCQLGNMASPKVLELMCELCETAYKMLDC